MFKGVFEGWMPLVLLLVVLLLFGAPKLPALAKSIGQSLKILRKEIRTDDNASAANSESASEDSGTDSTAKKP